jgi:excisionase family DNA binding protein
MLALHEDAVSEVAEMRNREDEVLTPEEIAEFLRVSLKTVEEEIQSGRLPAVQIGSESRVLRKDFEQFLRPKAATRRMSLSAPHSPIAFNKVAAFTHVWPNTKKEDFDTAFTATVNSPGGSKRVLVGYTNSTMHGKRRKTVVFVDGRPMVRFKAADNFDSSGLMLSIVKTGDRKQLRPGDPVPPEYAKFQLVSYRDHIDMPYSSKNMALMCKHDDLQTMAEHALIRAQQVEERKQ